MNNEVSLYHLSNQYLSALLKGDKHKAIDLIHSAIGNGIKIRDIYLHVFQPVLYEIGYLWELNKVSVAQEHYCTAVTQLIMSQLYPSIVNGQSNKHRFIGLCVSGELHEVGLQMVCDFLEMEGWDTFYIGANTPVDGIIQLIKERKPDILGISATLTYHLPMVAGLINQIRSQSDFQKLKTIVGGNPFNSDPGLWKQVGSDAFARDANEAVNILTDLVKSGGDVGDKLS